MNRINIYKNHLNYMNKQINICKLWKREKDSEIIFNRKNIKNTFLSNEGIKGDVNNFKSKERSILIQTIENYKEINKYFPNVNRNNAGCGENFTISGLEIDNIFIGDILYTVSSFVATPEGAN